MFLLKPVILGGTSEKRIEPKLLKLRLGGTVDFRCAQMAALFYLGNLQLLYFKN